MGDRKEPWRTPLLINLGEEPRFGILRLRERARNVSLHDRHYNLCYALSTQRCISITETVVIPGKISIIPSRDILTGRSKTARHSRRCLPQYVDFYTENFFKNLHKAFLVTCKLFLYCGKISDFYCEGPGCICNGQRLIKSLFYKIIIEADGDDGKEKEKNKEALHWLNSVHGKIGKIIDKWIKAYNIY